MLILFILIATGYLFVIAIKTASLSKTPGMTWVEIDPMQCRSNPWQRDWAEDGNCGRAYPDYPRWYSDLIETPEAEIVRLYYEKQGVDVAEVKSIPFKEPTLSSMCLACDCLEGYTLYLLIPDFEVDKMVALGYKVHE